MGGRKKNEDDDLREPSPTETTLYDQAGSKAAERLCLERGRAACYMQLVGGLGQNGAGDEVVVNKIKQEREIE